MITRRRSKTTSTASGSPQLAKTGKVFAATSGLEQKRKAEQSMADQIAAVREMILQLIKGQEAQRVSQKQEVEELKAIIQSLICRFVRKRKIRNVTIATPTGRASSKSRNRAMDAGVDRYLTKPARMKDVTALIAKDRRYGTNEGRRLLSCMPRSEELPAAA
jgi:CheY-like chemotaxis protein